MIKNSFTASAKQLGFTLVEPHKLEDQQEQINPNISEIVYNASQKYRHLLNTFLKFSRDLILHSNGDESFNYYKQDDDDVFNYKQEIMAYKLQISDLRDKLKRTDKELKILQEIYQDHVDSRLQLVDFNMYNPAEMTEATKLVISHIKKMHTDLMDLQLLSKKLDDDQNVIIYEEFQLDGRPSENRQSNTRPSDQRQSDTLQHNMQNDEKRKNEFAIRRSHEVYNNGSYTAQLPRPSVMGGSITARAGYISPRGSKHTFDYSNRGSTGSTKPQMYSADCPNSSFTKPPKFKRESREETTKPR